MNLSQSLLIATATTTAVFSGLIAPVQAADLFGNSGIQFDTDTIVTFTFQGSNNQFQSTVSVFRHDVTPTPVATLFQETKRSDTENQSELWLTTCGATNSAIANCTSSFTFESGVLYTLGLFSTAYEEPNNGPRPGVNYVYSSDVFNQPNALNSSRQRVLFGSFGSVGEGNLFPNPGNFTSADPFAGMVEIAFEDGGYRTEDEDLDFNDFRVYASARPVPVPPALGGLALFGSLAYFRRRRLNASNQKA